MKNDGQEQEKKNSLEEVLDKKIDRRSFLQKTTKLAGVTFGLTLINSLGSIPVEASGASVTIASKYKKSIFQFGLVADAQYADIYSNGNTRYYRASLEKLADAVKTFNGEDLAFTVTPW